MRGGSLWLRPFTTRLPGLGFVRTAYDARKLLNLPAVGLNSFAGELPLRIEHTIEIVRLDKPLRELKVQTQMFVGMLHGIFKEVPGAGNHSIGRLVEQLVRLARSFNKATKSFAGVVLARPRKIER